MNSEGGGEKSEGGMLMEFIFSNIDVNQGYVEAPLVTP